MSVLVTGLLGSPLPDCPVLGMSFMNESFFQNHSVFFPEKFSNVIVNGPYQENIRKYGLMAAPPLI